MEPVCAKAFIYDAFNEISASDRDTISASDRDKISAKVFDILTRGVPREEEESTPGLLERAYQSPLFGPIFWATFLFSSMFLCMAIEAFGGIPMSLAVLCILIVSLCGLMCTPGISL